MPEIDRGIISRFVASAALAAAAACLQAAPAAAQGEVTLGRYEPATNGYVISSPRFEVGVGPGSAPNVGAEKALAQAHVRFGGGSVEGYKYNGRIYRPGDLGTDVFLYQNELTEINYPIVKVAGTVTYRGSAIASFTDATAGQIGGIAWSGMVDIDSKIEDYAISGLRVTSARNTQLEQRIENALSRTGDAAATAASSGGASSSSSSGASGAATSSAGSPPAPTGGSRTDRRSPTGASESGSEPALSPRQQAEFDSAVSLARRYESAGNYDLAIMNYRAAYGIRRDSWIAEKIQALGSRQSAEAERQRRQTEEAARAGAEGLRAAGELIAGYEQGLDDDAPRAIALDANLGLVHVAPNGSPRGLPDDFSAFALRADGELELNHWFSTTPSGWLWNMGAALGADGSIFETIETDGTGRYGLYPTQLAHHYLVKFGWRGIFEVGYGARSYTALDEDGDTRVEAKEGLMVLSAGWFLKKGGSWRASYVTTTETALLGGGDGEMSENTLLFSYWMPGSALFFKGGMTTRDDNPDDDLAFTQYFVTMGISLR